MAEAGRRKIKIGEETLRRMLAIAALGAALLGAPMAAAQTYPDRPITLSHGFGPGGIGSGQHRSGELLASLAGIQLTHVAYKGGLASLTDTLSGQIDFFIDTLTLVTPQLDAGAIRGLAVTSPKEWRSLHGMPP